MEENKNAYSEVIEILKLIDDEKKLEALPMEMLEVLKLKSNPEYKPQISKEIPLEEQNLHPDTLLLLTWIAMKYWNGEGIEDFNLKQEENVEEKLDFAKDTQKISDNETTALPISYKDLNWYEKIRNKIIEFLRKIFKKNYKTHEIKDKQEGSSL